MRPLTLRYSINPPSALRSDGLKVLFIGRIAYMLSTPSIMQDEREKITSSEPMSSESPGLLAGTAADQCLCRTTILFITHWPAAEAQRLTAGQTKLMVQLQEEDPVGVSDTNTQTGTQTNASVSSTAAVVQQDADVASVSSSVCHHCTPFTHCIMIRHTLQA